MKTFQQLPKLITLLAIGTLCASMPAYAQQGADVASKGFSSLARQQSITPESLATINRLKSLIGQKRYSLAMVEINSLSSQLKKLLGESLASAFPAPPQGFQIAPLPTHDDDSALFYRVFESRSGGQLELSIVTLDPSYDDYLQMIKNPSSVTQMETASIIEISKSITAIERFSPADKTYERHVILGGGTMLHIVSNNSMDKSGLDAFCDAINYAKIQSEIISKN